VRRAGGEAGGEAGGAGIGEAGESVELVRAQWAVGPDAAVGARNGGPAITRGR
jgi:hypothetical protein